MNFLLKLLENQIKLFKILMLKERTDMKTKDVPAIIMLLAGGLYCLFALRYRIPVMEFLIHLLIILLVFWMFGGIVKMVLDRFMNVLGIKNDKLEGVEGENSQETDSVI